MQLAHAPPSIWQANVLPASVEVKLKLALVEVVGFAGFAVIVVFGAVRSIVQVKLAGVPSVFPAASVALTWKVCEPAARPLYVCGLVQAAKAAPSSEHWKLEPVSVELKLKLGPVELDGLDGVDVIVVSGAVSSIVHVYVAGVGSVFPTASVARTWKVCEPAARLLKLRGLVQAANAAPSSEHWKVEPASFDVKLKHEVLVFVGFGGVAVMVVSGAVRSIVQVRLTGVASVFPAGSVALTSNVWLPSVRPV